MKTSWKNCPHPRTPENTGNRSARKPGGRCFICWRASRARLMRRARAEGRSNGYENNPARRAVAAAVKAGLLVNLKKDYTVCADAAIRLTCAGRASMYDHRDYARPLDVEPVCRSCNGRRGAARKAELAVAS